jgi:uncharacterized membrane protein YGL010W
MLKPALEEYLREYDAYHRHPINRLTHEVAIPLIVFHILTMLSWISLGAPFGHSLNLGHLVWLAVVAWYLTLDVRLGVLLGLLYALCFPIAAITPRPLVFVVAVAGWGIQLAGHVVWEKRQPAFMKNLLQALIGPLFFVASLVGVWPAKRVVTV